MLSCRQNCPCFMYKMHLRCLCELHFWAILGRRCSCAQQLYYHNCSGRIPGHTTREPQVGFKLETNCFQFYAITNLDKTSNINTKSNLCLHQCTRQASKNLPPAKDWQQFLSSGPDVLKLLCQSWTQLVETGFRAKNLIYLSCYQVYSRQYNSFSAFDRIQLPTFI